MFPDESTHPTMVYSSFDSRYLDPIAEVDPVYCIQIYVSVGINQIYILRVPVHMGICIGIGMGAGMGMRAGMVWY